MKSQVSGLELCDLLCLRLCRGRPFVELQIRTFSHTSLLLTQYRQLNKTSHCLLII